MQAEFVCYATETVNIIPNLASIPSFIRFREVNLYYFYGSQSINAKCKLIDERLKMAIPALINAKINLKCTIDETNRRHFNNHSALINYLRNDLLPIVSNSPRRYNFQIGFNSDKNAATEVIDSILQMSQISRCKRVEIIIWFPLDRHFDQSYRCPLEGISNWLSLKSDDKNGKICDQTSEEKFLRIYLSEIKISNFREIWEHLSKVKVNSFPESLTFLNEII